MNLKDRMEVFERDAKLLAEISQTYPHDSEQYQALHRASSALWHVLRDGHTAFEEAIRPGSRRRRSTDANAAEWDWYPDPDRDLKASS